MKKYVVFLLVAGLFSSSAMARICDHKPSKLISAGATGSVAAGTGATAATGIGMNVAGFYTLANAATGATMLASTAAGASAAGTVGIIGGTAGAIGTACAVLMSPFVIVPAALVVGSIGLYEGVCYFFPEKKKNTALPGATVRH